MTVRFEEPYIKRKVGGHYITFDVTRSGSLVGTNRSLQALPAIMSHFREADVKTVLDFGAGKLRNTWPFLQDPNFQTYICEFEELIPQDDPNLKAARGMGLRTLIYPKELQEVAVSFDGILLSYVLNILPDDKTRREVLEACWEKAKRDAILVVASPNYNTNERNSCSDDDRYDIGWIKYASDKHEYKTFYSEPSREHLMRLASSVGFVHFTNWRQRTAKVLGFRKE